MGPARPGSALHASGRPHPEHLPQNAPQPLGSHLHQVALAEIARALNPRSPRVSRATGVGEGPLDMIAACSLQRPALLPSASPPRAGARGLPPCRRVRISLVFRMLGLGSVGAHSAFCDQTRVRVLRWPLSVAINSSLRSIVTPPVEKPMRRRGCRGSRLSQPHKAAFLPLSEWPAAGNREFRPVRLQRRGHMRHGAGAVR